MEQEILEMLSQLVKIPSMDGQEAGVTELVEKYLKEIGMEVSRQEVLPNRENVIGKISFGNGGKTVVLNTHMDVVPVGAGWTKDPFTLEIDGDKAYARGACDAKGPLVCMISAIKRIIEDPKESVGTIIMTAVVDEEDFSRGSRELITIDGFHADYGIVGEPTECQIATCHKGSMRPIIRIEGKTAHAALPEQGVNAIEGAAVFVTEMESLREQLKAKTHKYLGAPTATLTKIAGGVKENVVPDWCEMVIDRRLVPGETDEEAKAEVEEICKKASAKFPKGKIYIKELKPTTGGPSEIDDKSDYAQAALHIAEEVNQRPEKPYGLFCVCDMTHLKKLNIPCVVVGPGSLDQAHQADEFVEIDQLRRASLIYEKLMRYALNQ